MGYAKAIVQSNGKMEVELEVRDYHFDTVDESVWHASDLAPKIEQALYYMVTGSVTHTGWIGWANWFIPAGWIENRCTRLQISTKDGHLTCSKSSTDDFIPMLWQGGEVLKFHLDDSEFNTHNQSQPRYWALPLTNYMLDVSTTKFTDIDTHPLCITPHVHIDNQYFRQNRLLPFFFAGEFAFVEYLPDMADRVSELKARSTEIDITAVMVGKFDPDSEILSDLYQFAVEQVMLVSFACNEYVGFPWIELRNSEGKLVRRWHIKWTLSTYVENKRSNLFDKGLSNLLTNHNGALKYNRLHMVIVYLIESGRNTFPVSRLRSLSTASDILTHYLRKMKHPVTGKQIKDNDAIVELSRDITKIYPSEKLNDETFCRRIAGLKNTGIPDFNSLDEDKWKKRYKHFRNAVIHDGKILNPNEEIEEAAMMVYHLQDMLVRIILMSLNYDGHYRCVDGNERLVTYEEIIEPTERLMKIWA